MSYAMLAIHYEILGEALFKKSRREALTVDVIGRLGCETVATNSHARMAPMRSSAPMTSHVMTAARMVSISIAVEKGTMHADVGL